MVRWFRSQCSGEGVGLYGFSRRVALTEHPSHEKWRLIWKYRGAWFDSPALTSLLVNGDALNEVAGV
jgi:hypothetical protein